MMREAKPCAVPVCSAATEALSGLCTTCWRRVPLALRTKWWDETDFGHRTPTAELVEEIQTSVQA